ncbi:MAG: low temperature requirement protein A [Acidobacteria bacterium]|nr:low temperature requirement protein A [Acidobacteriota bacterium]
MIARSPHEPHRVATPLELFFDLVFVVAIAQAAAGLHHAIGDAHALDGLVGYLMVFFAIWWAWMNFTWFASAYDSDDTPYRVLVFVQITGALIMAAGVPDMFEHQAPNVATLGGYVVMRLALVTQWLRAAAADAERRTTALRYAGGVAVAQVAWVAAGVAAVWSGPVFLMLVALELAVPAWAERAGATTWHPHHIAERYGLLVVIVLGESILASTLAVQAALKSGETVLALTPIISGALLISFSMWWVYFDRPAHGLLTSLRKALTWGYGHYLIFAAVAAVGAGIAVSVDQVTGHGQVSARAAGYAVAIPVALYLVCLWALHSRSDNPRTGALGPITAVLVMAAPLTSQPVLVVGLLLVAMLTVNLSGLPRRTWKRTGSAARRPPRDPTGQA